MPGPLAAFFIGLFHSTRVCASSVPLFNCVLSVNHRGRAVLHEYYPLGGVAHGGPSLAEDDLARTSRRSWACTGRSESAAGAAAAA